MTRKEYIDFLQAEVYNEDTSCSFLKKHLMRFYYRNFVPQRRAVYMVRRMQYYHQRGGLWRFFAIYLQRKLWSEFGCFISEKAIIGKGFHLAHPTGVVVGVAATLGRNVSLYQQVTIGGGKIGDARKRQQPTLGDDVTCFAGSKILGAITVGNGVTIGANCVVLRDCEDGGTYVGAPARRVK